MPGLWKKVRFSTTTTLHHPETPLLTDGTLTPASSAGLVTPPDRYGALPGPTPYTINVPPVVYSNSDHGHGYPQFQAQYHYPVHPSHYVAKYPSPQQYAPPQRSKTLPPQASAPTHSPKLKIHPYLESSSSRHPAIVYDLLDPPSQASRHHHTLSPSALSDPATSPPTQMLTIQFPNLPGSWELRITGSSSRGYVTLGDVLERIYGDLRQSITQREWESLRRSEQARTREAYENRYRRYRTQAVYLKEKAGGMKRIDFLLGKTKFLGLSRASKRGEVWAMNAG
ncbi:hypothetical protein MD484_g4639, partial [Candolleomyces efflorescens]